MELIQAQTARDSGLRGTTSPVNILIVDDEPDLAFLFQQKFRHHIKDGAFHFLAAADGQEALEILQANPKVDIIFTDINMPRMDGLSLLSKIREMKNPLLKSIVISAYGDMENIRMAMNNGAFDFVTKPINLNDLESTLFKTLDELSFIRKSLQNHDAYIALQQELSIARDIQSSMLPPTQTNQEGTTAFNIFACMETAREVGGDFYDFFQIDDDRLGIVIGDVCGKGIPAAIFMAVSKTSIKAVGMGGGSSSDCLNAVNKVLENGSNPETFVTAFYGILNLRNGELEYCNAGHNLPFLIDGKNRVRSVPHSGGIPLGFVKNFQFEKNKITLQPNDTLFLYTDGVTEAFDAADKEFSEKGLSRVLQQDGHLPLRDLCQKVFEAVHSHSQRKTQADDMTLLSVRYLKS
ncbi:MAG: SpoIIE family protein phosphatase [Calditrichia bacterium]